MLFVCLGHCLDPPFRPPSLQRSLRQTVNTLLFPDPWTQGTPLLALPLFSKEIGCPSLLQLSTLLFFFLGSPLVDLCVCRLENRTHFLVQPRIAKNVALWSEFPTIYFSFCPDFSYIWPTIISELKLGHNVSNIFCCSHYRCVAVARLGYSRSRFCNRFEEQNYREIKKYHI